MRQSDAGDFQVHRGDADSLLAKLNKSIRCIFIPRQQNPLG